jgi:hypothetical protein
MSFVHILWCSLSLLQVLNFFLKKNIIIMIFELKAIAKHLGLYYQNICKEIWKMSQEFSIKCMIIETNDNAHNWFLKGFRLKQFQVYHHSLFMIPRQRCNFQRFNNIKAQRLLFFESHMTHHGLQHSINHVSSLNKFSINIY